MNIKIYKNNHSSSDYKTPLKITTQNILTYLLYTTLILFKTQDSSKHIIPNDKFEEKKMFHSFSDIEFVMQTSTQQTAIVQFTSKE